MIMSENGKKAPINLNASSNLLGLCFVVLSYIKVMNLSDKTVVDNIIIFAFIAFMGSCILCFLAIRTKSNRSQLYEDAADYFFFSGLGLIFVTIMLISFRLIS